MTRGSLRTLPRQLLAKALNLATALLLVVLPLAALPASAQADNQKIAPARLAQMALNPLQRLPVIVEMKPGGFPFVGAVNVTLAQQAVAILQSNGQYVGGLPIVQGAAGYATAAGIQAMSLLPQVAAIDQDAVVRPQRPHVVTANNGATYMRLTCTSMSTAVVSWAAALLLERQGSLKPDQVKKILTAAAQPFGQVGLPAGAGAGLLDAFAATNSPNRGSANQGLRLADGAARALYSAGTTSPGTASASTKPRS